MLKIRGLEGAEDVPYLLIKPIRYSERCSLVLQRRHLIKLIPCISAFASQNNFPHRENSFFIFFFFTNLSSLNLSFTFSLCYLYILSFLLTAPLQSSFLNYSLSIISIPIDMGFLCTLSIANDKMINLLLFDLHFNDSFSI